MIRRPRCPSLSEQTTIKTSYDGRTITTTTVSANDQLGQSFNSYTPTFTGSSVNTETNIFVENANGTTTDTRSGSGSFDAPAYTQTVNVVTNADSSQTTTTLNYDGTGALVDQIVADVAPDGLVKSYAYDTTGLETIGNLDAAAADIVSGAALPASMLGTDIIESDTTTLNTDGSRTEVVKTAYGNGFGNLRSLATTDTSANGLVTTTFVNRDGSGDYKQIGTVIDEPDGSKTEINKFYSDTSGTQTIDSMTVGSTLLGTNTYTISADGLVTTLTTSTGVTDTTVDFANSNGSYEFSRSVTARQPGGAWLRERKRISFCRCQWHRYMELEQRRRQLRDDHDRPRHREAGHRDRQRDLPDAAGPSDGRRRDPVSGAVHHQWRAFSTGRSGASISSSQRSTSKTSSFMFRAAQITRERDRTTLDLILSQRSRMLWAGRRRLRNWQLSASTWLLPNTAHSVSTLPFVPRSSRGDRPVRHGSGTSSQSARVIDPNEDLAVPGPPRGSVWQRPLKAIAASGTYSYTRLQCICGGSNSSAVITINGNNDFIGGNDQ